VVFYDIIGLKINIKETLYAQRREEKRREERERERTREGVWVLIMNLSVSPVPSLNKLHAIPRLQKRDGVSFFPAYLRALRQCN